MGRPRSQLHLLLKSLVDNVYFQPPTNTKLVYPCIVYRRNAAETEFADNNPYQHTKRYMVTVIDREPDSEIPDQVAQLPMCLFDRHFTAEDLNHDVFNLFF